MWFERSLVLPDDYSFFLFGARGVGKSTLLAQHFSQHHSLSVQLLHPNEEARLSRNPEELRQWVLAADPSITHIILDEIQRVPKLLDVVHLLLESDRVPQKFVMTGSSAKQLKMAGVNLLAGRAFTYHLYPLSFIELGEHFILEDALAWGSLPKIFSFEKPRHKKDFLNAYAMTYLKEEISYGSWVRNLGYFRHFLEVAAQSNGKIIQYSNIARDVGVDDKTVKNYFSLLEDTLLGQMLEPFHHSFRKRLRSAPKFYYFDVGVARSLALSLDLKPSEGTSYYGDLFEQWIITECFKLRSAASRDYRLSYLMTASGVEVDLVVERPGQSIMFVEIKSSEAVREEDLSSLIKITLEFGTCEAICLSRDPRKKKIKNVTVYPWQEGLRYIFDESL